MERGRLDNFLSVVGYFFFLQYNFDYRKLEEESPTVWFAAKMIHRPIIY